MGSVDKVSIASAAVLDMREDTHLKGQEYAWTSAIIYFGGGLWCRTELTQAIIAIIPSLALMQKLPTNLYMCVMGGAELTTTQLDDGAHLGRDHDGYGGEP